MLRELKYKAVSGVDIGIVRYWQKKRGQKIIKGKNKEPYFFEQVNVHQVHHNDDMYLPIDGYHPIYLAHKKLALLDKRHKQLYGNAAPPIDKRPVINPKLEREVDNIHRNYTNFTLLTNDDRADLEVMKSFYGQSSSSMVGLPMGLTTADRAVKIMQKQQEVEQLLRAANQNLFRMDIQEREPLNEEERKRAEDERREQFREQARQQYPLRYDDNISDNYQQFAPRIRTQEQLALHSQNPILYNRQMIQNALDPNTGPAIDTTNNMYQFMGTQSRYQQFKERQSLIRQGHNFNVEENKSQGAINDNTNMLTGQNAVSSQRMKPLNESQGAMAMQLQLAQQNIQNMMPAGSQHISQSQVSFSPRQANPSLNSQLAQKQRESQTDSEESIKSPSQLYPDSQQQSPTQVQQQQQNQIQIISQSNNPVMPIKSYEQQIDDFFNEMINDKVKDGSITSIDQLARWFRNKQQEIGFQSSDLENQEVYKYYYDLLTGSNNQSYMGYFNTKEFLNFSKNYGVTLDDFDGSISETQFKGLVASIDSNAARMMATDFVQRDQTSDYTNIVRSVIRAGFTRGDSEMVQQQKQLDLVLNIPMSTTEILRQLVDLENPLPAEALPTIFTGFVGLMEEASLLLNVMSQLKDDPGNPQTYADLATVVEMGLQNIQRKSTRLSSQIVLSQIAEQKLTGNEKLVRELGKSGLKQILTDPEYRQALEEKDYENALDGIGIVDMFDLHKEKFDKYFNFNDYGTQYMKTINYIKNTIIPRYDNDSDNVPSEHQQSFFRNLTQTAFVGTTMPDKRDEIIKGSMSEKQYKQLRDRSQVNLYSYNGRMYTYRDFFNALVLEAAEKNLPISVTPSGHTMSPIGLLEFTEQMKAEKLKALQAQFNGVSYEMVVPGSQFVSKQNSMQSSQNNVALQNTNAQQIVQQIQQQQQQPLSPAAQQIIQQNVPSSPVQQPVQQQIQQPPSPGSPPAQQQSPKQQPPQVQKGYQSQEEEKKSEQKKQEVINTSNNKSKGRLFSAIAEAVSDSENERVIFKDILKDIEKPYQKIRTAVKKIKGQRSVDAANLVEGYLDLMQHVTTLGRKEGQLNSTLTAKSMQQAATFVYSSGDSVAGKQMTQFLRELQQDITKVTDALMEIEIMANVAPQDQDIQDQYMAVQGQYGVFADSLNSVIQDALRTVEKTSRDFEVLDTEVKKNVAQGMFEQVGRPRNAGFKIDWMNKNFGQQITMQLLEIGKKANSIQEQKQTMAQQFQQVVKERSKKEVAQQKLAQIQTSTKATRSGKQY